MKYSVARSLAGCAGALLASTVLLAPYDLTRHVEVLVAAALL